jgi:hypothetical protein
MTTPKYKISIKRVSDGQITHTIFSDDYTIVPKIPTGWDLENNHVILREELPSPYKENRQKEYPSWEQVIEALIENMEGRPEKLAQVKQQRAEIRAKYPKPQ